MERLKGTRDFYPEDWFKLEYLFKKAKEVSERFGFEAYEAPIIEKAELWLKKSGGEIPEQMYVFEDKNHELIALRPELTPSLARMVAAKHKELKKPIKWYSFPRVFRYERPQSGRLREFFQYNADIIGAEPILSSVEIISLAIELLKAYGLTSKDFFVRINNRKIVDAILKEFKVEDKKKVLQIIDKKEKVSQQEFVRMLEDAGVTDTKAFVSIFDKGLNELDFESEEGKRAVEETRNVFSLLEKAGYADYLMFDLSIVRGLDYYSDIVFEVFDRDKKYRAIAGGGSYANLIGSFRQDAQLYGVGFGMGDVVLSLLLEEKGLLPSYTRSVDFFVAFVGPTAEVAFSVATALRKKYKVYLSLFKKNLGKQLEFASWIGAKNVVIVGPRDIEQGFVTIRNMDTGNEKKLSLEKLLKGDV